MARRYTRRGFQKREVQKYDLGTPELRQKRLDALGVQRDGASRKGGWPKPDLTHAESPLGCLLWQGYLHPEYEQAKRMYDAGVMFAGWWTVVHPKSHAQCTLGQFVEKEPDLLTPAEKLAALQEAENNLKEATILLKRERQIYDEVVNTCVYQRLDFRKVEKLRTGLCLLLAWQKEQRRAA